jgi:hypothetical protein
MRKVVQNTGLDAGKLFMLLLLLLASSVTASNFYSWPNPTGSAPYNWTDKNNWSTSPTTRNVPNGYPNGPDDVVISSGHTITLNENLIGGVGLKSFTVEVGGVLTYSGTGGFDVNPGAPIIINGSATVYCVRLKTNGTLTVNSGGSFSTVSCNTLEGSSSHLIANGTVTISGNFSNAGVVDGTGMFTIAAGTIVTGSGTVYGVTTSTISTTSAVTVGSYTWTGVTNTTWGTTTNWALGTPPSSGAHNVSILKNTGGSDPHIITTGQACGKLFINPGNKLYVDNGYDITASDSVIIRSGSTNGKLVINPGGKMTISGKLVSNCDTGGINILSDASNTGSLIHNSDNVKGNIKRYIAGSSTLTANKYHLVSVPLTSASTNLYSSLFLGSYLYDYTESTGAWNAWGTSTTLPMDVTKGFMIFYPSSSATYSFPGPMNNGTFTATVSYTDASHGFNLVPNPYPSSIDWNAASGWTKTNIGSTIYIYNSSSQNYASWNGSTGTNSGSRYISTGQAFFVQATASSPALVMTNSVRVHQPATFLKNGDELPNSIRVKALANSLSDEAVVLFSSAGNNQYDPQTDAAKFYGSAAAPQIWLQSADNKETSIKVLPFSSGPVVVPMGFTLDPEGMDTLIFSGMDGFDPGGTVYLQDSKTGESINLKQQSQYVFSHLKADEALRFSLHFNGISGTGETAGSCISIYRSGDLVVVDHPGQKGGTGTLEICDAMGRTVCTRSFTDCGHNTFPMPDVSGLILVKVQSGKDVTVKKIMNFN